MSFLQRSKTKEKQPITPHPTPRSPIAEFIWHRVREKNNLEPLSVQSLQNLAEANEALKHEALVVYVNHTDTNDVPVALSLVLAHLTNARKFAGPAGMKHYDFSRDPKNALLLRSLKLLNIHALPVVQHNDLEQYSPEAREQLVQFLKAEAQKILRRPRSIYAIAPEGTRNQSTGTLQQARPGIGKIQKLAHNLRYMPIAITYEKHAQNPQVVVGSPETLGTLLNVFDVLLPDEPEQRAQVIADLLMYKLSLLLPEHLRGFYTDFEI